MSTAKRVVLAAAILAAPRAAEAATCSGRPTDPGGYGGYTYGSDTVKTYDTTQVRVHYATTGIHSPDQTSTRADGVPDLVAFAGDTAEDALTQYANMGFKKIPSDAACASNGGDGRVDIYLVTFTGADGTTVPEACDGLACSSFVLSQAKFIGTGYANPQEGFKTVVSHELFHGVQNAYDQSLDRFWAEGSAQWAMKSIHPELQDFERQLPAFFSDPHHSLDSLPSGVTSGYLYGSAVWPLFLTTAHGQDMVRLVLEAEVDGTLAMVATDKVLQTKGSSIADAFPTFAAWNVATKGYAGTGGYPDAAKYPGVKVDPLADGANAITSGYDYYGYVGTLDAPKTISLDTDTTRNAGLMIPLDGGKAQLDKAAKLPTTAQGDVIVVVAGITTKKTDAPFTIHLADPGPNDGDGGASSSGGSSSGGCRAASDAGGRDVGAGSALAALGALAFVAARRKRS